MMFAECLLGHVLARLCDLIAWIRQPRNSCFGPSKAADETGLACSSDSD